MKLICSKISLYEAVINVSKAISDKSALPVLEGIKFRLSDNILELTGYDMEIGIKTEISVKSEDKGEFIVNARLFSEMIKKMPVDDILIEVSSNFQVTLSSGVTTFSLFATTAEEYPELPSVSGDEKIEVCQHVLKDMINQTIFAVATTDTKPILKGELFEFEEGKLTLAAIDGYRLAVRTEPVKYTESTKFVVPSKALNEITGLLSDNDDDVVNMQISTKYIIFDINGYKVYSRLLEGEFHPYKSAIPKDSKTEVVTDRKSLIASLERTMLLINDRTPSPVRCFFENGAVKINCSTTIGKINDEIAADISGPVIEIGFKCRYLLDPLKVIKEDKVKIQMGGSLLPMKIVPCNNDGSYTFLVLPVRMPKEEK